MSGLYGEFRNTIALAAIASVLGLGCGRSDAPAIIQKQQLAKQTDYRSPLDIFVDTYNNGDAARKRELINEKLGDGARLIPFSYNPEEKASNVRIKFGEIIDVEYLQDGNVISKFQLDNRQIRIRLESGSGKIVCSFGQERVPLELPSGYSLLVSKENINPQHAGEMFWGLRKFARGNPHLIADYKQVEPARQSSSLLFKY